MEPKVELKGRTILIGKNPENGSLMIAINDGGQLKATNIGQANCVPNCVSRCKPATNIAHCKIEFSANEEMKITNIKEENVTYVNGIEIRTKRITTNDIVTLGKDRYPISISTIVAATKKILGPKEPDAFSISGLKDVWDEYYNGMKEIEKQQRKTNIVKQFHMPIMTVSSTVIAFISQNLGLDKDTANKLTIFFGALAGFFIIYGLYRTLADNSIKKKEKLKDDFESKYICSNPKCNHFLGYQSYKLLRQNKNCPYCKAKWVENEQN